MTVLLWLPAAPDRFTPGRGATIDRIVLHTSTTTFDGTVSIFQGGGRLVSANYVVDKDTDRIAQCVADTDTAWHAGDWPFNMRSLGIENIDDGDWNGTRPDALYARTAALVRSLCLKHAIPIDATHIVRHNTVTSTACPDALDTDRIIREAAAGGTQVALTPDDKKYIDQRIRDLVMGEPDLTAFALKHYLGAPHQTGAEAPQASAAAPTQEEVQAGHGRG